MTDRLYIGKSEASAAAHTKVMPMKYIYHLRILELLEETDFGLTADEAANKLEVIFTKIRPRFCELENLGKIEPWLINGKQLTRKNNFGNACGVYRLKNVT